MSKPLFFISCPIDTYSGYGARSRDLVRAIIATDKYDVKVLPQRWGNTPCMESVSMHFYSLKQFAPSDLDKQ